MLKIESRPWTTPAIVGSSFFILVLDSMTMRGTADYIFYFIPVALTAIHHRPEMPVMIAGLSTALSVIGFFLSASNPDLAPGLPFMNRMFAIITIWIVALMVRQVIKTRNENIVSAWIRDGLGQLAEQIRGELSIKEISDRLLAILSKKLECKVAAVYHKKEYQDSFQFVNGIAFTRQATVETVKPGEGVLGQVAVSKRLEIISPLSAEHLKISSASGESHSVQVIALPLLADNEAVALVEMAFLRKLEPHNIEFLNQISEMVGIAIKSAERKHKLAELLVMAQKHAEELQAQQEELRVVNEELEQQSKALKESHVRMENQQAELEQSNQQLEEQAQELEYQKNQLNTKNQELEYKSQEVRKSSNYKSEFLANMSHELRTPLNSSLILAKLLSDNKHGNLTKEQIEYAQIIYNSGNDLLNLINDILDLSKVEAGKMTVVKEVVFIEQVVKNVQNLFKPIAMQKNIEFKIDVHSDVPHDILTDRQRLEQILKNFLSNAFKFTSKGGVSLQIFMSQGNFSFAVSDTGVGMTPEEQGFIFEAFRQADGTTNRKFGGTGLGLTISKELAKLLGGEISVRSSKGEGSTFTLVLPKDISVQKVAPAQIVVQRAKESEEAPLKTFTFKDDRDNINQFARRMLIVEDDETFARVLLDLAHEMNFGAVVCESGEEGLSFSKTMNPHAIVLDVKLPDHSGMIVLDQLKMNTKTRHIPVHIISAEDFSRSALEMGAAGYMLKPVKKDQLAVAFQNMTSMLEQKTKHVLVVEDDDVQRKYITDLILDQNVKVTSVETSTKALELLSKQTFDCMIMDLSLPDMSGHELLAKLSNESSTYSFPPVIVYTARDLTSEEEDKLRMYSGSIIIKGAKSPERLLSEVTLFLHKVETELPPERQKMLKDLRSREKNLENRLIMIVDDDVRNIFALTATLESHGAKVETARNGREALEKLNGKIDLILMDIMMPEMDGYEAMQRIRQDKEHKDIPILALTAKAMKDDKEKCIEAGANDYLAKPIEVDKLLSLIRIWLPQKRKFS